MIDSPPGTGDEPLSVAQMVGRDAAALVVTTPQDLAIADNGIPFLAETADSPAAQFALIE